jgi:hypothetical protein
MNHPLCKFLGTWKGNDIQECLDVAVASRSDAMKIDEYKKLISLTKEYKYPNKKIFYDGYKFDSIIECDRYKYLKLLEKANEIACLSVHPRISIVINGEKISAYIADFLYYKILDKNVAYNWEFYSGQISKDINLFKDISLQIGYATNLGISEKVCAKAVIEDVKGRKMKNGKLDKGTITPIYRIKKKLIKAIYGIKIQEIIKCNQ